MAGAAGAAGADGVEALCAGVDGGSAGLGAAFGYGLVSTRLAKVVVLRAVTFEVMHTMKPFSSIL